LNRGLIAAGVLGVIAAGGLVVGVLFAVKIAFWVAGVCGIGAFSVASITLGYDKYCKRRIAKLRAKP